ncbi:MAG: hypothetical protein JJU10_08700 [Idiomarina sp.]|nr:hypothetical protein [Idiomarina sp.]
MNISDQDLSAFLDGELKPADMTRVRDAIAEDESLADRLAAIAMADQAFRSSAANIDDAPLSPRLEALVASAQQAQSSPQDNLVQFKPKQRRSSWQVMQVAQAASFAAIMLIAGFSLGNLSGTSDTQSWHEVAQILETRASGREYSLSQGSIRPQLTFQTQEGVLCRQFQQTTQYQTENRIACRQADEWTLMASVPTARTSDAVYQVASGNQLLDTLIDRIIVGAPLTHQDEAQLLRQQWQP